MLLILGQLRSPFLPWDYGSVPILWLILMLIPTCGERPWSTVLLLPLFFLFAVTIPLPFGPATVAFDLWYTLAATVVATLLCLGLVARFLCSRSTETVIPAGT